MISYLYFMPSTVPGFAYDVFVSYRHKDNRGTQWVTAFIEELRAELDATFKEDVSVYFDNNADDGLLETHHVHKSLAGKLKCLVFVPVISQTYCDPNCFAWQHELCAFNSMAREDHFGRDIKLRNGNVASRILPVRIHDLSSDDLRLLEDEIGGPLRSIDFIYRDAGVNRPLRKDDEDFSKKQQRSLYRNQINKVANAIRDLIEGMQGGDPTELPKPQVPVPNRRNSWHLPLLAGLLLVVAMAGFYVFGTRSHSDNKDEVPENELLEKSIAVLPFDDMTAAGDMQYLGDGLAEEIINSLTAIRSLKVVGRTSSFQFKGDKLDLRDVGERLNVGIVLEGSVQRYKNNLRITAQLVRTADNFHIWSERYDLTETNIFKIQDNIASNIADKLQLTLTAMEKDKITKKEIDPEAYSLFLKGLFQYKAEKFDECIPYEMRVLQIDSTYAPAYALIGLSKSWLLYRSRQFSNDDAVREAVSYAERSIALDPELAEGYSAVALISWSLQYNFSKAQLYFKQSVMLNPASSLILNRYGYFLTWMGDFTKANEMAKAATRLDPVDYNSYVILSQVAIYSGQLADAMNYIREWKRIFGASMANIALEMEANFEQGLSNRVIEQGDSLRNNRSLSTKQLSLMANAYYKMNRMAEGTTVLNQLRQRVHTKEDNACFDTALVFAGLQNADSTFWYLARSGERHESNFAKLKVSPGLKGLKEDARYIALYEKYGFDRFQK